MRKKPPLVNKQVKKRCDGKCRFCPCDDYSLLDLHRIEELGKRRGKVGLTSYIPRMAELTFKSWLSEAMTPQPQMGRPGVPGAPAAQNPQVKNVSQQAIKAASAAVKKGGNPMQAVKDSVLAQAQMGKLNLKDLGKVMPDEDQQ